MRVLNSLSVSSAAASPCLLGDLSITCVSTCSLNVTDLEFPSLELRLTFSDVEKLEPFLSADGIRSSTFFGSGGNPLETPVSSRKLKAYFPTSSSSIGSAF